MNYRPLKNQFLRLDPSSELLFDAGTGTILIPPTDTKVFLHWTNENGKLINTFTLARSTLVQNKIKIINGSDKAVSIHAIDIDI